MQGLYLKSNFGPHARSRGEGPWYITGVHVSTRNPCPIQASPCPCPGRLHAEATFHHCLHLCIPHPLVQLVPAASVCCCVRCSKPWHAVFKELEKAENRAPDTMNPTRLLKWWFTAPIKLLAVRQVNLQQPGIFTGKISC